MRVLPKGDREWVFELEELISHDPGGRGISHMRCTGELFEAARALWDRCVEQPSAERAVVIATGLYIPEAEEIETDGPPGAFALARALSRLGVRSILVSDEESVHSLRRTLREVAERGHAGEMKGRDVAGGGTFAGLTLGTGAELVTFPRRNEAASAEQLCARLVREAGAMIAIERVGPAADGRCYTSRGTDISEQTAPVERLFDRAASYGMLTIGMGDGGNEIGMGKVWTQVARHIPNGRRVGCAVSTDWLIAAGLSNWAAYGLVAALSILAGRPLLPDPSEERAWLEAHAAAGLVDGLTFRPDATVDGIGWDEHETLLGGLHRVVRAALDAERSVS